ncbi:MAG: hypothetical protein ACRD0W_06840 [Acidimicrobiales bacterium]
MSNPQFHPIPGDPDAPTVSAMFDATSDEWILTASGDYHSAAVQAMKHDGTDLQTCVILEWPGRVNHSTEHRTVRLMMSPDDAIGLADVLAHTARWLLLRGLS